MAISLNIFLLFFLLVINDAYGINEPSPVIAAYQTSIEKPYMFARCESLAETDIAEVILKKAMKNINLPVKVISFPPVRIVSQIISGKVVGEVDRIESYGFRYPFLLRVVPSHYKLTSVAFVKKTNHIKIKRVDDLKQYKVGAVRGIQHSDDALKDFPNTIRVVDSYVLFKMLNANRFDIGITSGIDGVAKLKELGMTDLIEPIYTFAELDLFIYLRHDQYELHRLLSKELTRMQIAGELAAIIKAEEAKFFYAAE
jgi:polar amino acid transport system substrate-binding protein